MLVLGLSGSLFCESWGVPPSAIPLRSDFDGNHDAAAVLIEDGVVVAAIEQERLDRIKHSGSFPVDAIRSCLAIGGRKVRDLDAVAWSYSHATCQAALRRCTLRQRAQGGEALLLDPAEFIGEAFRRTLNEEVDPGRIKFVNHHLAHAASAYFPSGYSPALIATIDGAGENDSGSICIGDSSQIHLVDLIPPNCSLGRFYLSAINLIGLRLFDEYKAMGLAPYGDSSVFKSALAQCYELKSDGRYSIDFERLNLLVDLVPHRNRSDAFEQAHIDLAAAVQHALRNWHFIS